MDRARTCCFTGNRPEKLPWGTNENDDGCLAFKAALDERLCELYAQGYRRFICGMARGGDTWFAEAVLRLKAQADDAVALEAAVPCPEQARAWNAADKERYAAILARCDTVTTVCPQYTRYCMSKRNNYMVDQSSAVISLLRASGGTASTVAYAKKRGLRIIEL